MTAFIDKTEKLVNNPGLLADLVNNPGLLVDLVKTVYSLLFGPVLLTVFAVLAQCLFSVFSVFHEFPCFSGFNVRKNHI